MRIGFGGGGTGGHVFPVQSLIKYIDKKDHAKHEFYWFGERGSLEEKTCMTLQNKVNNLYFLPITSGKRRREKEVKALIKNIIGLFGLILGIFVSLWDIATKRIDVIFCKGGFVSLPVVIAGWILRKRILLHESDTKPGLANRICSLFASSIFTGFEGVFPGKEVVVGQIIDDDLIETLIKKPIEKGKHHTDQNSTYDLRKTHILVTGGSQGAKSVYEVLAKILEKDLGKDKDSYGLLGNTIFHVILGTQNQQLGALFQPYGNVIVYPFVDQKMMGELLTVCDLSITRGGTTSLAEQQLFGVKKIIIPIPWTHDQLKNAQFYAIHHDDIVVEQTLHNYSEILEEAIYDYCTYKKCSYPNPSETITTTKEIIRKAIIQKA